MKNERFLSQQDAGVLSRLAENLLRVGDVKFNRADRLIELIAGSILLPENSVRQDYVCLHSTVTYRAIGSDDRKSVVIVCPHDANDVLARISILAPLAMALLGRVRGSIVEVPVLCGYMQYVEIVDIHAAGCRAQSHLDATLTRCICYRKSQA